MKTYSVFVEIDRPEKCSDCRFGIDNTCVLDGKMRYVSHDGSRPYWCALNFATAKKENEDGL